MNMSSQVNDDSSHHDETQDTSQTKDNLTAVPLAYAYVIDEIDTEERTDGQFAQDTQFSLNEEDGARQAWRGSDWGWALSNHLFDQRWTCYLKLPEGTLANIGAELSQPIQGAVRNWIEPCAVVPAGKGVNNFCPSSNFVQAWRRGAVKHAEVSCAQLSIEFSITGLRPKAGVDARITRNSVEGANRSWSFRPVPVVYEKWQQDTKDVLESQSVGDALELSSIEGSSNGEWKTLFAAEFLLSSDNDSQFCALKGRSLRLPTLPCYMYRTIVRAEEQHEMQVEVELEAIPKVKMHRETMVRLLRSRQVEGPVSADQNSVPPT